MHKRACNVYYFPTELPFCISPLVVGFAVDGRNSQNMSQACKRLEFFSPTLYLNVSRNENMRKVLLGYQKKTVSSKNVQLFPTHK